MLAAPTAELGTNPLLATVPAMERFTKRKRHHAPIARLLQGAPELQEMARSIANCSNALQVLLELPEGGDPFALLTGYNPCNRRACPMCEWRRSMVWRGRLLSGLDELFKAHPTHKAIFCTFTVRNVPIEQLGQTIKDMHAAWNRMAQCKFFPTPFWFRRTEVTVKYLHGPSECAAVNNDHQRAGRRLKTEDPEGVEAPTPGSAVKGWGPVMAHPHIHSLLIVPASYFSHGYIKNSEWQKQWMMAARLDYAPVVDIRAARAKFTTAESFYDARAAGIEAMKYTTKATDMVKLTADLPEFVHQMRGHRVVAMSQALGRFVPEHDPTAAEMGSDTDCGLPRLHPAVSCLAQWDSALSDYVLTPQS